MFLKTLNAKNFRNLDKRFDFSKGLNMIIGANGKGKTNLLECVNFFATGKSFRTNNEINCVNTASFNGTGILGGFSRLEAQIRDGLGNVIPLEIVIEKNGDFFLKKTLKVNSNRVSLSKFTGNIYSIIFSPDTIDLVNGTPSQRRRDLDDFLGMIDDEYLETLTQYKKVVRNRNKLLEDFRNGTKDSMIFWNKKLIEYGAEIIYKRALFFKEIKQSVKDLSSLYNSDGRTLEATYVSKFLKSLNIDSIKKEFCEKLKTSAYKEIQCGKTLYGPHREDFEFYLDGKNLKEFGSRGEQRLGAFILKIAQWKFIKKVKSVKSLLLLDDIFSELDKTVGERIQKFITGLDNQVFLTTTDTGRMYGDLRNNAAIFEL